MNDDVVSLGFDLTQIFGRTEEEATQLLEAHGYEVRVVEINNKPVKLWSKDDEPEVIAHAKANLPKRVNLNIVDGEVSSYRLG
jgi:hypothetical protein